MIVRAKSCTTRPGALSRAFVFQTLLIAPILARIPERTLAADVRVVAGPMMTVWLGVADRTCSSSFD
jgi:hypothetical protein